MNIVQTQSIIHKRLSCISLDQILFLSQPTNNLHEIEETIDKAFDCSTKCLCENTLWIVEEVHAISKTMIFGL